ncbi:hypothetical protein PoB_002967900 [Plakobranchus ocellatus]|uniref:Uncharacterized protein n=1 Tax=Plakobranchus ocellatus TaxID=259542 RepID=A0AAV4A9M5_9GAST|nr:hypothetical protein PoB_002967900 [Plakobranchus ocellatus]
MNNYCESSNRVIKQAASCRVSVSFDEFWRVWGVGGSVVSESALRSAGTLLSPVRAPPLAPCPDGGPKSLRSPCCGLAIYKLKRLALVLLPEGL